MKPTSKFSILAYSFSLLVLVIFATYAYAQNIDMNQVNKAVSEAEKALAGPPAPPLGVDTKQAVQAANELADVEGEFDVAGESEGDGNKAADSDKKVSDSGGKDAAAENTDSVEIMSFGNDDEPEQEQKQVVIKTPTKGTGSPGLFYSQYISDMSSQECMRRAKAAFEAEGMFIGNGDYWWYGASEPRYHSYNNCLDIGGGRTIINLTTASWRMDTSDHLNRLIKAFNSPDSVSKKTPYKGSVERQIPELYMWVQMRNMSQAECIKRGVNAVLSEGLNLIGSNKSWVGAADGRFNTYIACTDLGNGQVYINVTTTSSQAEDIAGHRDRITSKFN